MADDWHHDPGRNQYYRWSEQHQVYIYDDNSTLDVAGNPIFIEGITRVVTEPPKAKPRSMRSSEPASTRESKKKKSVETSKTSKPKKGVKHSKQAKLEDSEETEEANEALLLELTQLTKEVELQDRLQAHTSGGYDPAGYVGDPYATSGQQNYNDESYDESYDENYDETYNRTYDESYDENIGLDPYAAQQGSSSQTGQYPQSGPAHGRYDSGHVPAPENYPPQSRDESHDENAAAQITNIQTSGGDSWLKKNNRLPASGRLKGAPAEQYEFNNALNKNYFVQKDAFFVEGKVIKVYWPEAVDPTNRQVTVTTLDTRFRGERIHTKIRWFIIIRSDRHYCNCIPINTYQGRGVAKKNVNKAQHAIAFSGNKVPPIMEGEKPKRGQTGMMTPIAIVPSNIGDRVDPMARIDFGRTYTVEYNIRVADFGMVHRDYMATLKHQWELVSSGQRQR